MSTQVGDELAIVELTGMFQQAMAAVCSPVSVVTTYLDGRAHGTTVSAFTSLSMDPPMVLISLDRGSDSLRAISAAGSFGLNVLSSQQAQDALVFAKKGGPEKFHGRRWSDCEQLPRLDDVAAFVACQVESIAEGGDHQIVLGRVTAADVTGRPPLTYHNRTFGTHNRLTE
ncbi:hypothetical protein JCM18899A_10440 [Nocardioides sp. AN3]